MLHSGRVGRGLEIALQGMLKEQPCFRYFLAEAFMAKKKTLKNEKKAKVITNLKKGNKLVEEEEILDEDDTDLTEDEVEEVGIDYPKKNDEDNF